MNGQTQTTFDSVEAKSLFDFALNNSYANQSVYIALP